jgi:hypothetical protein
MVLVGFRKRSCAFLILDPLNSDFCSLIQTNLNFAGKLLLTVLLAFLCGIPRSGDVLMLLRRTVGNQNLRIDDIFA